METVIAIQLLTRVPPHQSIALDTLRPRSGEYALQWTTTAVRAEAQEPIKAPSNSYVEATSPTIDPPKKATTESWRSAPLCRPPPHFRCAARGNPDIAPAW